MSLSAFAGSGDSGIGYNGFEVSLNYITGVPNVNLVSDPQLKVVFKSLLKRDETTKEKALADLAKLLSEPGSTALFEEYYVVTAWVQLYPKLSIDGSKNVRAASHQIQADIVKLLGKKYAKYLKDTTPAWLAGTFDSERIVARAAASSLVAAFQSQEKVDLLWKAFAEQCVHFCYHTMKYETRDTLSDERSVSKDVAEAKFLRVMISVVEFTTKLLDTTSVNNETFSELLALEELWDLAGTKDLGLKKSLLVLIINLLKRHPDLVDPRLFKTVSKAIVKSIKYKPATNNVIYSPVALPTLSAILNANNFSAEFWTVAGKKTKEKVFSFLELGSCSSSEIYYDLLSKVLDAVPSDIVDTSSTEDFSRIITILENDVRQEKLIAFKSRACICYFQTAEKFHKEQAEAVFSSVSPFLTKLLQGKITRDTRSAVVTFLQTIGFDAFLSSAVDSITASLDSGDSSVTLEYVSNVFDVLAAVKTTLLDQLITLTFSHFAKVPKYSITGFMVLGQVVAKGIDKYKQEVGVFLTEELPSVFEKECVDQALSLLKAYNDSNKFCDSTCLNQAFNAVFTKVLMVDDTLCPKLLESIPRLNHLDVEQCEDVRSFMVERSAAVGAHSEDGHVILGYLTPEIFSNLFKTAVDTSAENLFISEFLAKFDHTVLSEFLQREDPTVALFLNYIFRTIEDSTSRALFGKFSASEYGVVGENLLAYVSTSPSLETEVLSRIVSADEELLGVLLPEGRDLVSRVSAVVGESTDPRLAIANPLESSVLLSSTDFKPSFDFQTASKLIAYAKFIANVLLETNSTDLSVILWICVVGEISSDYSFLSEEENDFSSFANDCNKLLLSALESTGISLKQFIDSVINEADGEGQLWAITNDLSCLSFYANRVLRVVLIYKFENSSNQELSKLEVNYNKLLKSPLKFNAYIISSRKFLSPATFDRIRNVVGSELIGLNSGQIVGKGLTYLTCLQAFLVLDIDDAYLEEFVPIPEQRLNMILRDVGRWVESDVAYDDNFIPVRIQLISFVINYMSLSRRSSKIDIGKFLDFGLVLLRDSVGVATAENDNSDLESLIITLKYFSLKLYIQLYKSQAEIEAWDEEIEGINEELVEALLLEKGTSGAPYYELVYDLYFRAVDEMVPLKFFEFDRCTELLNCKGSLQKLGTAVLQRLILKSQQDYVIEYELSKSKLSEMQDDTVVAGIPQFLVANVREVPEEYVEYEDAQKMFKYLWSWLLIFDHFKDVTQRIRHDYIRQLQEEFEKLFTFVFDQIDLNSSADVEFVRKLADVGGLNAIDQYYVDSRQIQWDSIVDEQKHLIIHLYYLSLNNVGSVVQTWFNSIRNRQLKNAVEKFTVSYISPIVIQNELGQAADLVKKNNINNENFTIKINRATFEIKSLYQIDEKTMEMVIKIPNSYPLQNVVVDGPVRLGVKEAQWKAWLMASQRIISSQNSTIIGAIELFNKNVSLHFSGFEECAICYSILHYQDNSLPSKTCTTCNNKFHAACLYKWFKSSGGSTCPLCRSTFNFRK